MPMLLGSVETTPKPGALPAATLELLWQDDATAFAVLRDGGGELSSPPLESGSRPSPTWHEPGTASPAAGSR